MFNNEARQLTAALRERRGTLVGIGCKKGLFAVTETRKVGRKQITDVLTPFQSYENCIAYMRAMAED